MGIGRGLRWAKAPEGVVMQGFAGHKSDPARAPSQTAPQAVAKPRAQRKSIAQIIGHWNVQPKLQLGARNDPLEQEADRTAERVVAITELAPGESSASRPPPISPVARAASRPPSETGESAPDETSELEGEERDSLPEDLTRRIGELQHRGRPLPRQLRDYMEPRFGRDFSSVRIHTDEPAAQLSESIHARAFTLGEHIAFGRNSYQPESPGGRKLIAHELTHVVQQRGQPPTEPDRAVRRLSFGDIPGVSAVADFIGDAVDSAGNLIASKGWGLVRRYAPGLEPILRKGPLAWLKDTISSAFDGVVDTLNQLSPGPALDTLTETFSGLLERAGTIMQALMSGNCEPLFNAIGELKSFVVEVAGNAWNRLTDFLSPVGDFFSELWASTGARAVDWLSEFAGDTWDSIQNLGRQIWDWSQPIRDAVGAAWDWIKKQLFGSEENAVEDNAGGITGWITAKASQAWNWVKDRTRPVWQPIQQGMAFLNELIPPEFISNLGEDMSELSQNLNQTEQQLGGSDDEQPGRGLAANREALVGALPSLQSVLTRVRAVLVNSGQWLTLKVGGLRDKVLNFFTSLKSNTLLAHLSSSLNWLESGIRRLWGWAENSVVGLFNRLVEGFDRLTPLVTHLLGVTRRLIAAAGDLLTLPQLILSNVWGLIPECIRNPIKDFLVEQILGRIPVFNQLMKVPDLWERAQATAMRIVRQVFVDGNISAAAWSFFQAMLKLIGLPPQLMVQVLARAAGAIGEILTDPIGFITNALRAVWQGFSQFFRNIGNHLLSGVSGWFFGHMRDAGITPPENFSLRSVLGVVMQILDITRERIFDRLGRRIGRSTADRLRSMLDRATGVWRFVRTVVEEGPGALWEELQQRLSDLGNQLLDGIVGWVTETIIQRVSARLLTMLDPSGIMAVVNALVTLYQTIETFAERLREMLEVVNSFLQGVNDIAKGSLSQAANFLENAMGQAIPVILAFLGKYAGLGNLSERIREMVESIRERVDAALDWLIDRAIRGGRALIDLARRGGRAVKRGARALANWWKPKKDFKADNGEEHSLYTEESGTGVTLMMASEDPKRYQNYLEGLELEGLNEQKRKKALGIAKSLDENLATMKGWESRQEETGNEAAINSGNNQDAQAFFDDEVKPKFDELVEITMTILPEPGSAGDGIASTPPIYGPTTDRGFGTSVEAPLLGKDIVGTGSTTASAPPNENWEKLRKRKKGKSSYFVRGHLLNHHLGGKGEWKNLTPLTRSANATMSHSFEEHAKEAVEKNHKFINYIVTANYSGSSHPLENEVQELRESGNPEDGNLADVIEVERDIPSKLEVAANVLNHSGDSGKYEKGESLEEKQDIKNEFFTNSVEDYSLSASDYEKLYINDTLRNYDPKKGEDDPAIVALKNFGSIDEKTALDIANKMPSSGYRTYGELRELAGISEDRWRGINDDPRYRIRLYSRP